MAEVDIPPGYGIPLVNLANDLLPDPTMDALDARYAGGGSGAFEYTQAVAQATWTIPVPGAMGRRPNVSVFIGNENVDTDVVADSSQVVITFSSPQSGTAVLT